MANIYIGSLIDFDKSVLMHPERWTVVQEQIKVCPITKINKKNELFQTRLVTM